MQEKNRDEEEVDNNESNSKDKEPEKEKPTEDKLADKNFDEEEVDIRNIEFYNYRLRTTDHTEPPNKQKPVKNTRLFGLFHTSDPSLSRDNSHVVEVIVDDLITGLGPSFTRQKLEFISQDEHGIFTWENYFSPIFFNYIF